MISCMRCGVKLQHNYLVKIFVMSKEKTERLIVCFKCRDILKKQEANKPQEAKEAKEVKEAKGVKKETVTKKAAAPVLEKTEKKQETGDQ